MPIKNIIFLDNGALPHDNPANTYRSAFFFRRLSPPPPAISKWIGSPGWNVQVVSEIFNF